MLALQEEAVAAFVLQVNLVHRPGVQSILGSFNLWKKGGWFGKADELFKFCTVGGCVGFMSDTFSLSEREAAILGDAAGEIHRWPPYLRLRYDTWYQQPAVCPACQHVEIREELADSYGFNMTPDRIARRMCQLFDALNRDADIYLVRTKKHNIFQQAQAELNSPDRKYSKYFQMLEDGRDRESVLYPLKKLIADTADAGSPEGRFKALVKA